MCFKKKRASNSLLFQYHYPVAITAITTALLATVVLILAVWKCYTKSSPGGTGGEKGGGEGEEEEVYEEMGGDEGGVAVANDLTYMEIGD